MINNKKETLKVTLSDEELKTAICKMQKIISEGEFTKDWTYAVGNRKNRSFKETYICGEDEYRDVMVKLSPDSFYEAEWNNSPKAQMDPDAAKEIVYKFIPRETFYLRDSEEEEKKQIYLYVKFDFPSGEEDSVVVISFHESKRSLEEQRKYDNNRDSGQE